MDRREALDILQDVLDSFPDPKVIDALESDDGPGYRHYESGRFTDAFVRNARKALAFLRERRREPSGPLPPMQCRCLGCGAGNAWIEVRYVRRRARKVEPPHRECACPLDRRHRRGCPWVDRRARERQGSKR